MPKTPTLYLLLLKASRMEQVILPTARRDKLCRAMIVVFKCNVKISQPPFVVARFQHKTWPSATHKAVQHLYPAADMLRARTVVGCQ